MAQTEIKALTLNQIELIASFLEGQNMKTSKAKLTYLIQHNPDLSQGVFEDGQLVGMVLCSYDGLKGYLNKLVVSAEYRQQGLGQKLIAVAVAKLKELDCPEVTINCKPFLAKWYEKQGFTKQDSAHYTMNLCGNTEELYACG